MDSAADGLLALSSTAAALANNEARLQDDDDDDRSSSLSELEDAPEIPELEVEATAAAAQLDADSEAETERLEESPDKFKRKPFGISPSKLAQTMSIDERPEIEALTDSGISSPISPLDDSDMEGEQSDDGEKAELKPRMKLLDQPLNNKRKRLSDVLDAEDEGRIRRRRTGSIESDIEKEAVDSDNEDGQSRGSREPTIEPLEDDVDQAQSERGDEDADEVLRTDEQGQPDFGEETKSKKLVVPSRSTRRRAKGLLDPEVNEVDGDNEVDESEDDVDADDADAQAKSEEEQAKRTKAMDALTELEQRFATLRDRLYDERIAQINYELGQLAEVVPSHPELLRQLECVKRYRDEKFEVEQKLLVFKVAALKRKSIAERSTLHSSYFQTIRDIREKHLERISEQFYRIQRDRFKSNAPAPVYAIPFAERRSAQITQQTAYNKEVSILSGVAKYVGFPAAPELPVSHQKELEDDMEKMGISVSLARVQPSQSLKSTLDSSISAKVAGEQFLEHTPWANPQHPVNRLGMNRQAPNKSPFHESYLTPAQQQRTVENSRPIGSASTIREHPSQPASSAFNTPHDGPNSQIKADAQSNGLPTNYNANMVSPTDTRKASNSTYNTAFPRPASQPRDMPSAQPSSPLTARANLLNSPKRTSSAQPDGISRKDAASPFARIKEPGATTGNIVGGRFGVR